jgi:pyruvate,water dikinase
MKLARGAKKIEETLRLLQQELPGVIAKTAAWQQRVAGLRWSQAEVLQIMEEIEHVGAAALLPYFAARHNLEWAYRRLLALLAPQPESEAAALLVRALGGAAPTVELEMAQQVQRLGQSAASQPAVRAWLHAGAFDAWQTSLPPGAFADELRAFMAQYGQRGLHEGEIAAPRWAEAPGALFAAIRACAEGAPAPGAAQPADLQPLLAAVEGKARKEAQQLVTQMQALLTMQSQALHAFAHMLAGTRQWALAAAREALIDHRITAPDAIFFYEVEEVKEMMTGEWNISDRGGIRATAEARQQALAGWRRTSPPALIWGERAAMLPKSGLPAATGNVEGNALPVTEITTLPADAILITQQPESAAAILLPAARAFVTAQGSPLDPLCACARSLGRPGVVAAGAVVTTVAPAARVAVDGALGKVTIL